MTIYERLEQTTHDNNIHLLTAPLLINGYYYSNAEYNFNTITLSAALQTTCERCVVLAEELGHHFTTPIDLFSAPSTLQERYERRALQWAARELVPLHKLIKAWHRGIRSAWELAEYLDVTEAFLWRALELYRQQYGAVARCGTHCVYFNPLEVRIS